MKNLDSELIVKAIEAVVEARNYNYKDCKSDMRVKLTKEENENYTFVNLKGYESATISINLQPIFSALYSVKINSNDSVIISIFKG